MRLIDADAMRQGWLENGQNEYVYDTNAVLDSIDEQPTIDPESLRPKGKWVKDGDFLICLNCESEINVKNSLGVENRKNFCPNCGARMEG
jgi:hypothetical protein